MSSSDLKIKEEGFTIIFEGTDILAEYKSLITSSCFLLLEMPQCLTRLSIIFVHGLGGSPQRTWTKVRKRPPPPSESRKSWTDILKGHGRKQELGVSTAVPEERDVFWPRDLLPKIVKNARIMTYGYDSRPFRFGKTVNQNTISEHARNMLNGIQRQRQNFVRIYRLNLGFNDANVIQPNRPLIFVAHCLGGIITKDVLKIMAYLRS